MSACEIVLLHAGGCLIETPPIEQPDGRAVEVWRWVATLWRDADRPDGWNAHEWQRGERGWWAPATVMWGDVVEFGVCAHDRRNRHQFARWWGWVQRITPYGLVVVGPYDHPMRAVEAARPILDELRLTQLAAPHDPELTVAGDPDR